MSRVLVTGGAGTIGAAGDEHAAHLLAARSAAISEL